MHNKDPYTILLSAAFAIPEVPDQWNCCWPLGLHSFTYANVAHAEYLHVAMFVCAHICIMCKGGV